MWWAMLLAAADAAGGGLILRRLAVATAADVAASADVAVVAAAAAAADAARQAGCAQGDSRPLLSHLLLVACHAPPRAHDVLPPPLLSDVGRGATGRERDEDSKSEGTRGGGAPPGAQVGVDHAWIPRVTGRSLRALTSCLICRPCGCRATPSASPASTAPRHCASCWLPRASPPCARRSAHVSRACTAGKGRSCVPRSGEGWAEGWAEG